MAVGARVDSIDAIKDFRMYLVKFQESASLSMGDADSDVARMERWLDGEAQTHWSGQIRKRQEILAKAEEALREKKLYKDATGSTPSAVEELKAVQIARKNLEDALKKMQSVKQWQKRLQKEINLYRGGVGRFVVTVSSGVPAAIAALAGYIGQLEKYTGIEMGAAAGQPTEAGAAVGVGTDGGESMARAAKEEEAAAAAAADPPVLRAKAPLPDAAATATALPPQSVWLAVGGVTPEQWKTPDTPSLPDEEVVLITQAAMAARRVYMLRTTQGWCLGSVDADEIPVYNKTTGADLKAARPDLGELLKLPLETLVVLGDDGLIAVYDSQNQAMSPPMEQAAT
jgi:hypothetical protein